MKNSIDSDIMKEFGITKNDLYFAEDCDVVNNCLILKKPRYVKN